MTEPETCAGCGQQHCRDCGEPVTLGPLWDWTAAAEDRLAANVQDCREQWKTARAALVALADGMTDTDNLERLLTRRGSPCPYRVGTTGASCPRTRLVGVDGCGNHQRTIPRDQAAAFRARREDLERIGRAGQATAAQLAVVRAGCLECRIDRSGSDSFRPLVIDGLPPAPHGTCAPAPAVVRLRPPPPSIDVEPAAVDAQVIDLAAARARRSA